MSANGVLRNWWSGQDLTVLSDTELTDLSRDLARCRNSLAGMVTQVAREATAREDAGSSPPADETLTNDGDRSHEEAGQAKDRAKITPELPETGAGIDNGTVNETNANTLAALVSQLTPTELKRLKRFDQAIQARMGDAPEVFAHWLARLAKKIADPPPADDGEGLSEAEQARAKAKLWMRRRPDGTWELNGLFDAERGAELNRAINAYASGIAGPNGHVTPNHRATALHELVMQIGDGLGRRNLGIGYLVDMSTGATEDWYGDPVDPDVVSRHTCDADIWISYYNQFGQPTKVGRAQHPATREQRLQLRGLYPTCPIDGVTPFARCEVHHIIWWDHGGETDLHNLVPVSPQWHDGSVASLVACSTTKAGPSPGSCAATPSDKAARPPPEPWTPTAPGGGSCEATPSDERSDGAIYRPDGQLHRVIPPPTRPPP